MSPDQLVKAAPFAGNRSTPRLLQFASTKVGAGVLTFVPSALVDAHNSYVTDQATGVAHFNRDEFLIRSAKSQSGNVAGFVGGLMAGGIAVAYVGALFVGWPVLVIGLIGGIAAQVAWNTFGGADMAEGLAKQALK
jgi:hypothetical protein